MAKRFCFDYDTGIPWTDADADMTPEQITEWHRERVEEDAMRREEDEHRD